MLFIVRKFCFFCASMIFAGFVACSNEDAAPGLTPDEGETASFESQYDSYFNEADDLVTQAFMNEDASNGRVSSDERLLGATILRTGSLLSGTLTIDFGTGITDVHGNVRRGIILLEHTGPWNEEGAQWTITFSGYSINGITIDGTRKVRVVSVTNLIITHEVELIDGRITWPDGTASTRICHYVHEREHDGSQLLNRLIVYGTAQGTLRNGRGYSIEILEDLVFDRSCADEDVFIAVQGKKIIKHGNRELTIDYGDGACDNFVTLTNKSGASIRYEVSK